MHQPVAEKNVADAEALRVAPGLLFAGERVNALAFGFRDRHGALIGVQQHVIHEAIGGVLEIIAEVLAGGKNPARDAVLADDVLAPALRVGQETPPRPLQELVDGDARLGF